MSQDDPNRPAGSAPLLEPSPPRSAGWLRATSIRLLRGTINALEQTVEQLEDPDRRPAENLPRPRWAKLVRRVRLRLPVSWQRALGDRALSGLLILVFLFPVAITANLIIQTVTPTTAAPPPAARPAAPMKPAPFPPERPMPGPFPPERPPAIGPTPTPTASVETQKPKDQRDRPLYGPPLPPPASAPKLGPGLTPSPAPTPSPEPPSPSASLTTTIQTQLAQIADVYAVGLIQAIQPNFKQSRLGIQMQDGWFELARSQQDALANALLERAQDLNFSKLELIDAQNRQLARSPVVGDAMIMLQRQRELTVDS